MNANAARLAFFVANVALLVAFSFKAWTPTNHPGVAAGMLRPSANSSNPQTPSHLSVALKSEQSTQADR